MLLLPQVVRETSAAISVRIGAGRVAHQEYDIDICTKSLRPSPAQLHPSQALSSDDVAVAPVQFFPPDPAFILADESAGGTAKMSLVSRISNWSSAAAAEPAGAVASVEPERLRVRHESLRPIGVVERSQNNWSTVRFPQPSLKVPLASQSILC